jgi:hypothetical protein
MFQGGADGEAVVFRVTLCLMRLRLLVLAGRSLSELIPRMAPGWGEILVNEDYE